MKAQSCRAQPDGVRFARDLPSAPTTCPEEQWSLDALEGRFIEVSGKAVLSACSTLILQAQHRGAWTAWIAGTGSIFYPPDFAASGIDVNAVAVVRVAGITQAAHAADTLLRSGAFAVVVMDPGRRVELPLAVQTRLTGLASRHRVTLAVIARRSEAESARGSLVSLRAETTSLRTAHDCFMCSVQAVKDKRRTPGWRRTEVHRGPDGLC